MRRAVILALVLILCGLLAGCQGEEKADVSDYTAQLTKAQEIAVIPVGASEAAKVLSGKEELRTFLKELRLEDGIEDWKLARLPKGAEETGSFVFSQENTLKFGEAETDGELHDICRMRIYNVPYVSLELGKVTATFEISKDTADKLNRYF